MSRRKSARFSAKETEPRGADAAGSRGNRVGVSHAVTDQTPWNSAAALGARKWGWAAVLLVAVVLAYQPAWHGGPIWDDDAHITIPHLRSLRGLGDIWLTPGATQQYYPLLHSVFWLEYHCWGEWTFPYHLVNILMHVAAALLVAAILRRLAVPGAMLAAAIFALHPVHVESVAWITELKNTLSAVFYLAAALAYLRFDQERSRSMYCCALGLFTLGLLSKTVTATLPAALLVAFWWQRGRLSWRRDVLPLVPFFVFGVAAGVGTAWVERRLIGAEGAEFDLSLIERCLIAGRAVWFYIAKLLWPVNLTFIYPRWHVSQTVWWQYLYPAAALVLMAVLWLLRGRNRGPLAGMLFFVGTLLPVLGFCNVLPFMFSFVADHFQYLASLGVIGLVAAGIATGLDRLGLWDRPVGHALCLILLVVLGGMSFRQCRMYRDVDTLYRTTIEQNPTCWLAENNLGNILGDRGRIEEAMVHYRRALDIKPNLVEARVNLGLMLEKGGQRAEASQEFEKALGAKPLPSSVDIASNVHFTLGNALIRCGKIEQALGPYRDAVQVKPENVMARRNLAAALVRLGQSAEAVVHLNEAAWLLSTSPRAEARNGPAALELALGATQLCGGKEPAVLGTLAAAYAEAGRFPEAVDTARKAVALAEQQNKAQLARAIRDRIPLYQVHRPVYQVP